MFWLNNKRGENEWWNEGIMKDRMKKLKMKELKELFFLQLTMKEGREWINKRRNEWIKIKEWRNKWNKGKMREGKKPLKKWEIEIAKWNVACFFLKCRK